MKNKINITIYEQIDYETVKRNIVVTIPEKYVVDNKFLIDDYFTIVNTFSLATNDYDELSEEDSEFLEKNKSFLNNSQYENFIWILEHRYGFDVKRDAYVDNVQETASNSYILLF